MSKRPLPPPPTRSARSPTTINLPGPTLEVLHEPTAAQKKLRNGLNKEFLKALDQKLDNKVMPRTPSEPVQNTNLPFASVKATKQLSKEHLVKPKHGHRRTVSVGIQKAEKRDKIKRVTLDTDDAIILRDKPSGGKRKSQSINRGKGKKLFDKLTGMQKNSLGDSTDTSETSAEERKDRIAEIKEEFANEIIGYSLQLMGLQKNEISSIQDYIQQNYTVCAENRITSADSDIFNKIEKALSGVSNLNSTHASAIKIQSAFRTFRVRKHINRYLVDKNEYERVKGFSRTFKEFLQIEKDYCKNLRTLISEFLTPARQRLVSGKEVIRIEEVSYIFSNVELILEVHQQILDKLEKIYQNDWPSVRGVGRVILDARKGLTSYGVYVGNYANGQENIQRLRSDKGSKFNLWLQEIENKIEHTFNFFLSEPLNHISKVEQALENMSGYVDVGTEERELIDAYSMIHETEKFVKEQLSRSENTAILMKIQRRVIHDKPLDFVVDDRKLLMESQFKVSGSVRVFILCSDILVIGKPTKNNQFRLKELRSLEVVQLETISGSDNSFIIKTPTAVYKVSGKTDECTKWIALLTEYDESNRMNKTIGIHLDKITKREGVLIPSIVKQCIERILAIPNGTETEGLFRISGEKIQIDTLKKIFDQCPPEARDLTPYSIHAIAGVLKLFFRELTEPLLSFALYDTFLQIDRSGGSGPLSEEQIEQFKLTLKQLKPPNFETLAYLLKFLVHEVSTHSDVNKMTPSNIAIVFGPTLMRPEVETMETTLNSPLVNHTVQRLIENFDIFFPGK